MLLEYNVDTNDEKMVAKAIELRRRVAARKLQESIDEGSIDANTLLQFKEKSRDERKTHLNENEIVAKALFKERVSVSRAEQQLNAEGQLRALGRDIQRASRISKTKIDVLCDLEQRIQVMRNHLREPKNPPVDSLISQELKTNDNLKLERMFESCHSCGRKIVRELLSTHVIMCQRRKEERSPVKLSLDVSLLSGNKHNDKKKQNNDIDSIDIDYEEQRLPVYNIEENIVTSLATFVPQPPRHCTVVKKGI